MWRIPNRYRIAGIGPGTVFLTIDQIFKMTDDATGTLTLSKGGAQVTRTP